MFFPVRSAPLAKTHIGKIAAVSQACPHTHLRRQTQENPALFGSQIFIHRQSVSHYASLRRLFITLVEKQRMYFSAAGQVGR